MPRRSPSHTPAARRLSRILADEDYGPKLVRLSQRDQRRVLDLIDANEGRQARAEILAADERRIERKNEREKEQRYPRVVEILLTLHGVDAESNQARRIEHNAEYLTTYQMRQVEQRNRGTSLKAYVVGRAALPPAEGSSYNGFWYR